ncbi:SLATT domain-containing protein [Acinetobacter sp. V102_4]|uniref:SLATT domain-containing protein n=1 Tax=Acinetobacter sp. V102_4 TaxID=3072984 RepID=UPI00287C12EB|nr:SLATT domain-containing protein [Acinetobacter sp. V102_4]MDS7928259.1 SLATT domain-containing protein [Acinetobacter sp. V102_4]
MNKAGLLKYIAETGYNVGFGAKKNFATYDLIEKLPGWIGFISTAVGILGLVIDALSTKLVSAIFVIIGICGLYISFYDKDKNRYENAGTELTKLFNELKSLYFDVKCLPDNSDVFAYQARLQDIETRYFPLCISKQILFSNWYAHYKFFGEHQISWIDEQLKFRLIRDKIPLSLIFVFGAFVIGIAVFLNCNTWLQVICA